MWNPTSKRTAESSINRTATRQWCLQLNIQALCLLYSKLYLGKYCCSGHLELFIDSHTVIKTKENDRGKKKSKTKKLLYPSLKSKIIRHKHEIVGAPEMSD